MKGNVCTTHVRRGGRRDGRWHAAGDVINDGTYTYSWDAEGHMTKVVQSATTISTQTYNALGQRVRDVSTSATTDEAYGAGGSLLWRYTGSSSNSTQRAFVPFNGRILAEYYGGSPGGTLFHHPDELGSDTVSTSYNGSICQEKLFYPFGQFWTGAGNCGMQPVFAQQPDYDPETNQYNTLARHYTPMGRWMSPDPDNAGADPSDPQTWNMYAYVRNNPTSVTDPSGLDFYLTCTSTQDNAQTCQQVQNGDETAWVQGVTASTGENGELQFTPTVISNDDNNNLVDQSGNAFTGSFDQSGFHFSSDAGYSGAGQFKQGSDETDVNGSGIYAGVVGHFISACGGSCKGRGSIEDVVENSGAVNRALGSLRQLGSLEVLGHRLSGAHDPGPEWMDSTGLDHVIRATSGKNAGKTELHFEGTPVQGGNAFTHTWEAAGGLFSGRAAAQRNEVLP